MSSSGSGLFNISEDHLERYQSLDARFIHNKPATFFFIMKGASMSPFIMDKDILIVDRSREARHKRIVVATLCGEMLCRRLIESEEQIIFRCENSTYKDIYVTSEMEMIIY